MEKSQKTQKRGSLLMDQYEMGKQLGQGTFAKVYHARNLKTNSSVAIKVMDKEKVLKAGMMEQVKREISAMKRLKHPNVVHLYEVLATKGKIYFVMEYVKGGELFQRLTKGRLKEDAARKYFQQLISAVDYCHSRGVYHRDLKPENLLLDENGDIKVSDFGLSALAETRTHGVLHTTCGTPAYVSPEVISRKGYDGSKADIWSCGVILFVLLSGSLPFNDPNLMEMYRKISKAEFRVPSCIHSDARKLITRMLNPNPNARVSVRKIVEHPWFRKGMQIESDVIDFGAGDPPNPRLSQLNAFQIITHSQGLDLSGLFEQSVRKNDVWFTCCLTACSVISKLEVAAMEMKLRMNKRDEGLLKLEGCVSIQVEIFEISPCFYLVEIVKCAGEVEDFQKFIEKHVRPCFDDAVWCQRS